MLVSQFKLGFIIDDSKPPVAKEIFEYWLVITNLERQSYRFQVVFKYIDESDTGYHGSPIISLSGLRIYRLEKFNIISTEPFELQAGETKEFKFGLRHNDENKYGKILQGHVELILPAVYKPFINKLNTPAGLPMYIKQAEHPVRVLVNPLLKRTMPNTGLTNIFYNEFNALEMLSKICIPDAKRRNFNFREHTSFPKEEAIFLKDELINIPIASGASLNNIIPEDPETFALASVQMVTESMIR